jgi:3-oxoacyl-ACP reductase-like protein
MRILMAIAIVVIGILAVVIVPRLIGSAPAAQSAVAPKASTPATSSTQTPTPSPSTAPTVAPAPAPTAKSEQQILDDIVASTVSVYSVLVCNSLEEYADLSIPEIITKVLAEYPTSGLSDQSRQIMAERVLTESAAKSCADQSPRVSAGIAR